LAAAHILRVNCNEMAGDRLNQDNLRMNFLALNADFSTSSLDPLDPSRFCAGGHQKGIPS